MSSTRMRMGAVVAAGALTFGLSACNGDDSADPTTPAATVEGTTPTPDTATGTQDAAGTTDDGAVTTDAGTAAAGEEVPVEEFVAMLQEPGEETLSSYTMQMDMDMEGQPVTADGAVDLSGDAPAMRIAMSMPDLGDIEMLMVDGAVYMAMPGMTPEGMYLLAPEEVLGDQADALEELNVASQWEGWADSAERVVFVGEEDGLRRYEVTVDTEAAAEAAGATADPAAMTGLPETMVYDVFLDEDNLMRRMIVDDGTTSSEITMDNWGEPQDIQAPAEDQIMDMDEMGTGPTG